MKGVNNYKLLEQVSTVTADAYGRQLDRVNEAFHWKCSDLVSRKDTFAIRSVKEINKYIEKNKKFFFLLIQPK